MLVTVGDFEPALKVSALDDDLPDELQYAADNSIKDDLRCEELPVEFEGKYYVAVVAEFDSDYYEFCGYDESEGHNAMCEKAQSLGCSGFFDDVHLILTRHGWNGNDAAIFLYPADVTMRSFEEDQVLRYRDYLVVRKLIEENIFDL